MKGVAEIFERMDPAPKPAVRAAKNAELLPIMAPHAPMPPKRFKLLSVADVHALPRLQWLIHAVLPAAGCAAIFGPSTSGKSFLALDMAAALAEGCEWFGQRIKEKRRVLYVALEGEAGFRIRVEAWEQKNGRPFPAGVKFIFQSFELAELPDILALAAAVDADGGCDVIIIDTLNRSAPQSDENSSADMGRILEGVRDLQGLTDSLVVLVHHTGKDATKGMRGHSSLFAALDAAIEVSRTDDRREWKVAKAKDGEDGQTHRFRLAVVDLGEDEEGDPITSCVVQPDEGAPQTDRVRPPKGGNQRIVYDALGPLFRESHAHGKGGAPAIRPCIRLDDAVAHAKDRLTVDSARRTERTRQALTGLVSSGVLGCNEGWVWLK